MVTREQNDALTRVYPGTPMGELMRRYWLPALLSWEIQEPDSPPVRVKLLGEDLVAFRDSQGRIGLIDEFCAHRRVSLWFGRNEECGLRCVYHGWKYDVDGNCVDQMNEPRQFADKIKITSYPTVEMGGVVWTYMGPAEHRPPPPMFEWTQVDPGCSHASKVLQESNWLQGLEGGIDTSHAPILHRILRADSKRGGIAFGSPFARGKAPTLVVDVTDYGFRYYGLRSLGDEGMDIRAYHFVMPFHQLRPYRTEEGHEAVAGHAWVPMDDENCMVYNWHYTLHGEPLTEEDRLEDGIGNGPMHVNRNNGFRSFNNRNNGYGINRQIQKTETFSGIEGINCQDRAVQESMGRIVDRTIEVLGPADMAIVQARKLLLEAMRTVQDEGQPMGVGPSYYSLRATELVLPNDSNWRNIVVPQMSAISAKENSRS